MRRSYLSAAAAATIAAASIGGPASIARADQSPSERGTFTTDETIDLCGFAVHHVETRTYFWKGRTLHGPSEGVFAGNTHWQWDGTFTNVANGRFFTESGSEYGRLLTAPILYDSVHEVTLLEVGTDVYREMDGTVMVREAGSDTVTMLFDDGGDDVPGNGTIIGEPTVTRVSGLHPLATATDEQICALVTAALAS
jgi:hypothetical protein